MATGVVKWQIINQQVHEHKHFTVVRIIKTRNDNDQEINSEQ